MYHLFMGDRYYPRAALGDYMGAHESAEEAEEAAREDDSLYDWFAIVYEGEDGRLRTYTYEHVDRVSNP